MSDNVTSELKPRMDKAIDALLGELRRTRTGRASISLLDSVKIEHYGNMVPLNHVANLSVPDSRSITAQPWDPSMISAIEKAILTSGLDLVPSTDGKIVRIPIPSLTEERRKDLAKVIKKFGEDTKVAIRNIRRDIMEKVKEMEKNKKISEDNSRKEQKNIQTITDDYIKKVDQIVSNKEKEIMEV